MQHQGVAPTVLDPTPEVRKKKNILVLDGGGLKGIFTLVILKKIEELAQCPIRDLFDLMVGCSTGGIIALGSGLLGTVILFFIYLALGVSPFPFLFFPFFHSPLVLKHTLTPATISARTHARTHTYARTWSHNTHLTHLHTFRQKLFGRYCHV